MLSEEAIPNDHEHLRVALGMRFDEITNAGLPVASTRKAFISRYGTIAARSYRRALGGRPEASLARPALAEAYCAEVSKAISDRIFVKSLRIALKRQSAFPPNCGG